MMFPEYERLVALLREMESVVVAFSAGVDSTFLARAAADALGDRAVLVTADWPGGATSKSFPIAGPPTGAETTRRGREKAAVELLGESLGCYGELQRSGQIASFEPVLLGPHGSDLNGFIVIRGERERLDAVRASDRFLDLSVRAEILCEGFGVVSGLTGEGVTKQVQRYQKFIA